VITFIDEEGFAMTDWKALRRLGVLLSAASFSAAQAAPVAIPTCSSSTPSSTCRTSPCQITVTLNASGDLEVNPSTLNVKGTGAFDIQWVGPQGFHRVIIKAPSGVFTTKGPTSTGDRWTLNATGSGNYEYLVVFVPTPTSWPPTVYMCDPVINNQGA
jgi:hypothetical protein